MQMLNTNSAVYRTLASLLVNYWGTCPAGLVDRLSAVLTEQGVYDELSPFLLQLQRDCHVSLPVNICT